MEVSLEQIVQFSVPFGHLAVDGDILLQELALPSFYMMSRRNFR